MTYYHLYGVEHDAILSKMGDITVAYKVQLPELFTLSNDEYESFHHSWINAIKVLPRLSVLHKQDWFTEATYKAAFNKEGNSFLSRSSERFFNERPYLDLLQQWNINGGSNPVLICRPAIMNAAKISSRHTYNKCIIINSLHEYGYIIYEASVNPLVASRVYLNI